jgi:hypothetical protein
MTKNTNITMFAMRFLLVSLPFALTARCSEDVIAAALATTNNVGQASDPLTMAPANYELVFENERVRVLMFTSRPGAKWGLHAHPDQVSIALAEYDIRNIVPGNAPTELHRKPGDVRWIPATSHTGENIGSTEARSVVVELKK